MCTEGSWDASSQPYMWPLWEASCPQIYFPIVICFSAHTWLSSREAMTDSPQDGHCNSCMGLEGVNAGLSHTPTR